MHEQPVLRRMGLMLDESHPHAEYIARRGFYLPSGLALTDDEIARSAAGAQGDSGVTVFADYAPWYDLLYRGQGLRARRRRSSKRACATTAFPRASCSISAAAPACMRWHSPARGGTLPASISATR